MGLALSFLILSSVTSQPLVPDAMPSSQAVLRSNVLLPSTSNNQLTSGNQIRPLLAPGLVLPPPLPVQAAVHSSHPSGASSVPVSARTVTHVDSHAALVNSRGALAGLQSGVLPVHAVPVSEANG
ncbi:hypothetical protein BV898_18903 [Hypsibius exemplaris]|uniref:Uncharacterized protein n=1 Tax=Hypsibius exemplaris TaxID=2072580 RepID=A0A9X6NKR9_HYPEX|nr:hypothetical protein BV898_18903 [Hypsibius exemplaris]